MAIEGRRIVFVSITIEALLEVICGRATINLPKQVPEDCVPLYSWIENDDQVVKIALSHPKFELRAFETPISTYRLAIIPVIDQDLPEPTVYTQESITNSEDWDLPD